jgi:hypothetical protein
LYKNSRGIFYPFKLSYWRGYSKPTGHQVNGTTAIRNRSNSVDYAAFEDEPTDKALGVQLNNVFKV